MSACRGAPLREGAPQGETIREDKINRLMEGKKLLPNASYSAFTTPSAAQAAGMSTEGFKDFCYRVSTFDYSKMDRAMDPLAELMEKTDHPVRLLHEVRQRIHG